MQSDPLGGPVSPWRAAWIYADMLTTMAGSPRNQSDEVRVLSARAVSIAADEAGLLSLNDAEPPDSVTALEPVSLTRVRLRHLNAVRAIVKFINNDLGATPAAGDPGYDVYRAAPTARPGRSDVAEHDGEPDCAGPTEDDVITVWEDGDHVG